MITKRFQNKVAESRISLPVTGIYALVMCLLGGMFSGHMWAQFGLLALASFLMMILNNANSLIRIYSRMVSCSFLVLSVMSFFLLSDIKCVAIEVSFISFYLFLFSAYQDKRAVGKVYYAFVMLGLASAMYVQILYLLPVLWIILYTNIMVGCGRTLLASVLGVLTPYWFIGAYYLYQNQTDWLVDHLSSIVDFQGIGLWADVEFVKICTIGFVVVLSFLGMIHFRLNNFKDKIRTRMLFEVFSVMSLVSMVMMAVHPQSMDYQLALLIVSTSPMVGHYFALTHTFWTNISFYVILIVSLALTAFNIWFPF
uniref:hypothetical protein n=1 Tax=Prevotella sp. TaxID=59823 RepID=UPI0040253A8F